MHRKLFLATLCLVIILGKTQAQKYSPLKEGLFWKYELTGDATLNVEVIEDKFNFEGQEYYTVTRNYSWGLSDTTYSRIDSLGNEIHLDNESWKESIGIPKNTSLNYSWSDPDGSWKHQIYSKHERLVTPVKTYEDCLVVQGIHKYKRKYTTIFLYFVKGIGHVGTKQDDKITLYLTDHGSK